MTPDSEASMTIRTPAMALLLLLALAGPAAAEAPAPSPPTAATNPNAAGPEHALLATLAGEWTTVYRITPMPRAKSMDLPGSATFRTTLAGLWIDGGTELRMGEAKVAGRSMYGYDRFAKRYVFLFVQERDTQPLFGYGVPDSTGRRITFDVPMHSPEQGKVDVPTRTVLDLTTPDRTVVEMHRPLPDGGEDCPLRIEYTRAR
jgi:hypothetical protein